MNSQIEQFVAFICEREAIRCRRESGQPSPWTVDPILRDYKFCNVRREDDRVTKGVAALYRERHKTDPELWFALLVARRAVNWPDTLAEIGYPVPWNPEHFKAVIRRRHAAGQKAYEPQAYKVLVPGKEGEQADLITRHVLTPIWQERDYYRPRPTDTLASFAARLTEARYMGGFYAAQVVADLKYAQMTSAPDWWTFALSGPGSRRGLDRIHGRAPRKYVSEAEWQVEFRKLYDTVRRPIEELTGLLLHAQDLQNGLCEYDKYCRGIEGTTRGLRRYASSPQSQTTSASLTAQKPEEITMSAMETQAAALTVGQQITRLQARWKEIAGPAISTTKWAEPTENEWRAWLHRLPFIVLLEDVLGRLNAYRGSVRTDASTYLGMIVNNDGPKFMAARAVSRPTFVDEEDEQVVFIPKRQSASEPQGTGVESSACPRERQR